MALLAGRREPGMIDRCLRRIVGRLVAGHARCHRDVVVIVDVAEGARRREMRARQRETGRRVIKLGVRPCHRIVALFAGRGERRMIHRRLRAVIGGLMAGNAGRNRNVVVVVGVAQSARRRQMRARQWPSGRRVIELAVRPNHRIVALLASRREPGVVDRRLRRVVGGLVAGYARRHRNVVVIVDVAEGARRREMRAC